MRKKELIGNVFAAKLTPETLSILEDRSLGSIKGIKLPINERCIDFYFNNQEHRIEMGQWYVEIRTDRDVMKMVWPDAAAKSFLKDVDDATF